MFLVHRSIYLSTLGILLAFSAGCNHDERPTAPPAPAASTASGISPAIQARLDDPNVPAAEKAEIRKHMPPGHGQ